MIHLNEVVRSKIGRLSFSTEHLAKKKKNLSTYANTVVNPVVLYLWNQMKSIRKKGDSPLEIITKSFS